MSIGKPLGVTYHWNAWDGDISPQTSNLNPTCEVRDDFIGVFDDYFQESMIDALVKYFDYASENKLTWTRSRFSVQDENIGLIAPEPNFFVNGDDVLLNKEWGASPIINQIQHNILPEYEKKFPSVSTIGRSQDVGLQINEIKLQRTKPGEGYHVLHCENGSRGVRDRFLAFMLYLNDVEEGGETEFPQQKCRFKPRKNRFLIWPAYFTHMHRGNFPISNDKYIATGWIEYGA